MRAALAIVMSLALTILLSSAPAAVRAQDSLPPQLILRPSYFYVDVDPLGAGPTPTSTETHRRRLSTGAIAGITAESSLLLLLA